MTYISYKIPQKHKCGETLEERDIPVNEKILSIKKYPVSYCPKCRIYKLNKYESKNPDVLGDLITEAQTRQNIKTNKSIYTIGHLEKMIKQLNNPKK